MECPSCGSTEVEWNDASGDAVCVACGTVCEENSIVSSIEFSEAGGTATVVGQFVSENCSKPYSGAMHASARSRYGFMRNSRETTLAKGRASIAEVAGRLRLQNHYVESAHRLFTFAVQRNFVQGRKTMHVVAVCLYIKCREDKSPHMLIDFSDALSVNVFTLGSCFLKFCRLLNIETPLIDPSLYIHRFAGRMELGNKTQLVAQAALRVVARMKRDWIQTGRRPAGICAAALLIAARTHGFPRTQAEIVKVLRVCGMTVRTRLEEFEATPAAQLTMDELRRAEIAAEENGSNENDEQDPPSFSRGRLPINAVANTTVPRLEDGTDSSATSSLSLPSSTTSVSVAIIPGSEATEDAASGTSSVIGARKLKRKQSQSAKRREQERKELYKDVEAQLQQQVGNTTGDEEGNGTSTKRKRTIDDSERESSDKEEDEDEDEEAGPRRRSGDEGLAENENEKNRKKPKSGKETVADCGSEEESEEDKDDNGDDGEEDEENFSDLDDDELSGFVLSGEEAAKKAAIWTKMNKQYLEDRAVKEKKAAEDSKKIDGGADGKKKKKRQYNKSTVQNTAEEALEQTLVQKKISKKINYEALAGIFNASGDLASSSSSSSSSSLSSSNAPFSSSNTTRFSSSSSTSSKQATKGPGERTAVEAPEVPASRITHAGSRQQKAPSSFTPSSSSAAAIVNTTTTSSSSLSSSSRRQTVSASSKRRGKATMEIMEEITEEHSGAPEVLLPSMGLVGRGSSNPSIPTLNRSTSSVNQEEVELEEEYSASTSTALFDEEETGEYDDEDYEDIEGDEDAGW